MAAPPYAPYKLPPSKTMAESMKVNEMNWNSLKKSGRNISEMFERNENVEVVELSPIEEYFAQTNYERSAENIRRGMVTPKRQIQNTSALAVPRKVPAAPVRKRKTRRNRRQSRKFRKN